MKKNLIAAALVVTLPVVPMLSYADIQLNGFASIRATSVSSDGGGEPYPNFSDGELSFKPESLFALQASADLGDKLSATVQLFADGQNDFDVEARWAYISYQLNDQHRLSAGKFVNPLFRQSEYEKVGYAHHFARLPKAVYLDFDFSTVEGVALDSQFDLGGLTLATKLLYGNWNGETYFAVTDTFLPLGFDKIYAVNAALSGDWWTLAGGFMATTIDGAATDAGSSLFLAAPGIAAAEQAGASPADVNAFKAAIQNDGKDGEYMFAAFSADYSDWLFDIEYVDYGIQDSASAQNRGWYAAIGRRFDTVTVTLHKEDLSREQGDYAFLSGVTHPVLQATGRGLKDAFAQREFDGVGLDVRWDFHPSAALKFDYFDGSDTRPAVGDYRIVSVGIDLIF